MIVTAKTSSSPEALSSRHDEPLLSNGKQTPAIRIVDDHL